MPPTDSISEKFISYWVGHNNLDRAQKELKDLQQKPVVYNGETDITCLWRFTLYQSQLRSITKKLDDQAKRLESLNHELITILESFSIPAGTRMTLCVSNATKLAFWYDGDRYLWWEKVGKGKR